MMRRKPTIRFLGLILSAAALASQTIEGRVVDAVTGEAVLGVQVSIFPVDAPAPQPPRNHHRCLRPFAYRRWQTWRIPGDVFRSRL
jgi:hypothetical protein